MKLLMNLSTTWISDVLPSGFKILQRMEVTEEINDRHHMSYYHYHNLRDKLCNDILNEFGITQEQQEANRG